jgi:hypothetical protein
VPAAQSTEPLTSIGIADAGTDHPRFAAEITAANKNRNLFMKHYPLGFVK